MLEQSKLTLREYSNEAMFFINKIKEMEDDSLRDGVQHVRDYLNSLKGLVPVYLYGIIERTLTVCFSELFAIIKSYNLAYNQISCELYPFLFTDKLTAFKMISTSKSKNLEKVSQVFQKINDDEEISDLSLHYINENITNCRSHVLIDIYNLLGIDLQIDMRDRVTLDEIVERRNAVAHGREKPTVVYVKSATDIIERHSLVVRVLDTCIDTLECYLRNKMYMKESYRIETPQ